MKVKTYMFSSFVCCRNATAMDKPRLFRSYATSSIEGSPNTAIWGTVRATTATPGVFKRMHIQQNGLTEELLDGSFGSKNPTKLLLSEAAEVFGPNREVSCIVSIGSGKQQPIDTSPQSFFQRVVPTQVISGLKKMAFDGEQIATEMEQKCDSTPHLYFRFNAEDGLDKVDFGQWQKVPEVESWTLDYLRDVDVEMKALRTAYALYGNVTGKATTSMLA